MMTRSRVSAAMSALGPLADRTASMSKSRPRRPWTPWNMRMENSVFAVAINAATSDKSTFDLFIRELILHLREAGTCLVSILAYLQTNVNTPEFAYSGKPCRIATTMSFAVIQTGGKQYQVKAGDVLKIEKLFQDHKAGEQPFVYEEGASVTFDQVLLVDDGSTTKVGAPYIVGAKVTATVVVPVAKGKKVMVVKYRPKSRYFKKNGHRQPFTEVKIESIG